MEKKCFCFDDHLDVAMDENTSILLSPVEKCRAGRRTAQRSYSERFAMSILKLVLCSSGYQKGGIFSRTYSGYLLLLCWFQFIFGVYSAIYCSKEGCDFSGQHKDRPMYTYTARNEQIGAAIASLGGAVSYTSLLFCVIYPSRRSPTSIPPKDALRDVKAGKLLCLLFWLLLAALLFVGLAVLYFYFLFIKLQLWDDYLIVVGSSAMLIADWTSICSCFAFGTSALALGTFADDTVRRLKTMTGKHLDDAIIIHRELKTIVSSTVSSYSTWFILHWFLYALTSVLALIVVADVHFKKEDTIKRFYFGFFFASHVFLFVFPCGCAAYVTSVCGAIAKKLNNTLSVEWRDDHLFKNRGILQQFVSYAIGSPVTFKIGRVTFNTTIAWVSFFLGFTGLLFHFF